MIPSNDAWQPSNTMIPQYQKTTPKNNRNNESEQRCQTRMPYKDANDARNQCQIWCQSAMPNPVMSNEHATHQKIPSQEKIINTSLQRSAAAVLSLQKKSPKRGKFSTTYARDLGQRSFAWTVRAKTRIIKQLKIVTALLGLNSHHENENRHSVAKAFRSFPQLQKEQQ